MNEQRNESIFPDLSKASRLALLEQDLGILVDNFEILGVTPQELYELFYRIVKEVYND